MKVASFFYFFFSSAVRRLLFLLLLAIVAEGEDVFLEWHVALNTTIKPVSADQPVRTQHRISLFLEIFLRIYKRFWYVDRIIVLGFSCMIIRNGDFEFICR